MIDENYNCVDIGNESDGNKIEFIENIISREGIPANFVPLANTYQNKIFFRADGMQREWILFSSNKFFCAYCLCFSLCNNHRLVVGIDYVKKCRISETLKLHETEKNHISAKNIYFGKAEARDCENKENASDKRIVLTSIVKIIIFLATHG